MNNSADIGFLVASIKELQHCITGSETLLKQLLKIFVLTMICLTFRGDLKF